MVMILACMCGLMVFVMWYKVAYMFWVVVIGSVVSEYVSKEGRALVFSYDFQWRC